MFQNTFSPTIDKLFNGYPHLIIEKFKTTTNENRLIIQRKDDGLRNLRFSNTRHVTKIKLVGNDTVLWELENKNRDEDTIFCDTFTGLNIIPIKYLVFCSLRIEIDKIADDSVTVEFEYIHSAGNRLLSNNYIKMFKLWYYDLNYNLLAFGGGTTEYIYANNCRKKDEWKETLEELSS